MNGEPNSSAETIFDYAAHLNKSHTKVQARIIKYVTPICIPLYIATIILDNCWHNWVQLFGFICMALAWIYGHILTKHDKTNSSIVVLMTSIIVFQDRKSVV